MTKEQLERLKSLGIAAREMAIRLDVAAPAAKVEPKRIYLSGKISGFTLRMHARTSCLPSVNFARVTRRTTL